MATANGSPDSIIAQQLAIIRHSALDEVQWRTFLMQQTQQLQALASSKASDDLAPYNVRALRVDMARPVINTSDMNRTQSQHKRTYDAANGWIPSLSTDIRIPQLEYPSNNDDGRATETSVMLARQMSSSGLSESTPASSHATSLHPIEYTVFTPSEYVESCNDGDGMYNFPSKRPRPIAYGTSSSISRPASSMTEQSSLLSSSYLTTPSSMCSPELLGASCQTSQSSFAGAQNSQHMSRQASVSSAILCNNLDMLRVKSSASHTLSNVDNCMFPFSLEEEQQQQQQTNQSFNSGYDAVLQRHEPSRKASTSVVFTGAGMLPFARNEDLLNNIGGAVNDVQPIGTDMHLDFTSVKSLHQEVLRSVSMQRGDSQQSAASARSNASNSSAERRASERSQRHIENGQNQRIEAGAAKPFSSSASYVTATTGKLDESSRAEKQEIARLPYKRPKHPRQMCKMCDEHKEGFHGAHELRRHIERAHMTRRKVWICTEPAVSAVGERPLRPLSICKQCQQKKHYNAYYNAAAHVRRGHFNPRKRGRRPKGEERESRAGKAGGNVPSIEWLKERGWIVEIEIVGTSDDEALAHDLESESSAVPKSESMISYDDNDEDEEEATMHQDLQNLSHDGLISQDVASDWDWNLPFDQSFIGTGFDPDDHVDGSKSLIHDFFADDNFEL